MARSTGHRPAARRRGRAANIVGWLVCLVVVPGVGISLIVGSVLEHGDAARTSYTQGHGVRRNARVISEHTTNSGKNAYSAVAVRLRGPVDGQDTTTVHVNGAPGYSPGAPVTVLVDPRDPGYAELPGAPYTSNAQWQIPLGIGLACIVVIPFCIGVVVLRQRRSRRRLTRSLLR